MTRLPFPPRRVQRPPPALPVLLLSLVLLALSDPCQARAQNPTSFSRDVVPVLTRAGCNAGTCHGTPTGKGGFRLSLRGYDPGADYRAIVRDAGSRRLDCLESERSLLLLKATMAVAHEGGRRITRDDPLYRRLRDWIAEGAASDLGTSPALVQLRVLPASAVLDPGTSELQLRVEAQFADGSMRDVTGLARLDSSDPTAVRWTGDGRVIREKPGEVAVSAEYLNTIATSTLLFLAERPDFRWPEPKENNDIDRLVFSKLKLLRIEPSPLAPDDEFLRRVQLDLLGKLPTVEETIAWLADPDPNKRSRLIDRLLEREEFADWWGMKWTDRLGCNQRFVGMSGAYKYHRWIRHAMAENVPEDELARRVLTAKGGNYSEPPAGFYRRLRDPQVRAEEVAQLFLGVRMQCARCHNHPAESWKQDDYYGLAAFFTRIAYRDGPFFSHLYDKEETVYVPRTGELSHPRTGTVVQPKFPAGATPMIAADQDRRETFALWLTSPDNPFFAKAAVNRVWFHLFGRGIVDPVDDMRSSNPPSHPELLDWLATDFAAGQFDRKRLIRQILNSATYQSQSRTTPTNASDERYFSHAAVRLLQAEQLLDAISTATGIFDNFAGFPARATAVSLPDGELVHPFLGAFGRPARAMACECEREAGTTLTQALHLVGSPTIHAKLRDDRGRAALLGTGNKSSSEILDELFLATLTRYPSPDERELLEPRLSVENRRGAVEDVLWMLLNHNEFLFQH